MRSRLFSHLLITLVVGGLLAQVFTSETASATGDNPYFWDAPVKFTQPAKPKPGRVRPPSRPKPDNKGLEESPLLALKYNVLKRGDGNSKERVDAGREFNIDDQLKLAITPNQQGFLYVVHRSEDANGTVVDQPHVIFPDPRINNGSNTVAKDREYVVPQFCQDFENPDDCWWWITPPNGKEFFTVIFSRDEITELPNKLTADDVARNAGAVNRQVIEAIKRGSGQTLAQESAPSARRTSGSGGLYVRNTSLNDNEELIDTIEIKHLSGGDDPPAAMTRALFVKKRADAMRVLFLKNGVPVDPSRDEFKAGDEIEVKYESNFKGYAYFVNITPEGRKCVMHPCTRSDSNGIVPGSQYKQTVGFDQEKGTEVLQVVLSRERIKFLDDAIKGAGCCDPARPCGCELSVNAASAADQLASKSPNKKGGIVVDDLVAVVPQSGPDGIHARGIKLAAGKDKQEGSFVAIEDKKDDNRLDTGQAAVFEIRLNHR
jgi:hypothetical protein